MAAKGSSSQRRQLSPLLSEGAPTLSRTLPEPEAPTHLPAPSPQSSCSPRVPFPMLGMPLPPPGALQSCCKDFTLCRERFPPLATIPFLSLT